MKKKLSGKVVIITGASSGFGMDASRIFAREGCRVVLAARRMDRLEVLADEINKEGGTAIPIEVDVSLYQDLENLVESTLQKFGRVDILFNNAGFGRLDWLETFDIENDINTQIDVNLRGVIQLTRLVLPSMITNECGTIINMSSIAGWVAAPLYSIYSATKFGLRGFSNALRREVKPLGIQVCAIYPGGAATEFSLHSGTSEFKRNVKTPSFMRMTSKYVAEKVVDLAKRPRRTLIIPWWMQPVVWVETLFPWITDLTVKGMVKKYHHRD